MVLEQMYTNCLSEAAYFIASEGEAAVIDPLRDIRAYLALAEKHQVKIKYIFETHFHADFLSGHLELASKTGATIVFGPTTHAEFKFHKAEDEEQFSIGKLKLIALHTPGHTLESTCYLLQDETGKDYAVFTGDTLFVGDVGRPDLLGDVLSKEELTEMLYDSLQSKIMPLTDEVLVYPAHGPGSACGKSLGAETFSTIGEQKADNYALKATSKKEFVEVVLRGLSEAPAYFARNAQLNGKRIEPLSALLEECLNPLSVVAFKKAMASGAWIVDTRAPQSFVEGFVPGSVYVGLFDRFAEWMAKLIPYEVELLLLTEPGKEEETIIRMARVGFKKIKGYLKGGMKAWIKAKEKIDMVVEVNAEEVALDLRFDEKMLVIDVRSLAEYEAGHIQGAKHLPLNVLADPLTTAVLDDCQNMYLHCGSGNQSLIAASLIKRQGFNNLRNVQGGWAALSLIDELPLVEAK